MTQKQAIAKIITQIKEQAISTQQQLNFLKRDISKEFTLKHIPTNIEILLSLPHEQIEEFKSVLLTKPTRTISGVSPVAIMTRPDRCPHGKCTFCPGGIGSPWGDVPQSYTGHEPATMRGLRNDFDAYFQVFNRLEQYILLGQTIDKIEIIVMGGTFPATAKEYQEEFIYGCFKAMNDFSAMFFSEGEFDYLKFKEFFELPGQLHDKIRETAIKGKLMQLKGGSVSTLLQEQECNETAQVRCVALCIETKPDWGFFEHGQKMLEQGCTRVELGVESVYDDVLDYVHRGHSAQDSKKSIQILRDLGFKINFHYMPGLPLTNRVRDIAGMKQLFDDQGYKPDMIKFYPCMVAPATALYYQYKKGEFEPINTQEAAARLVPIKEYTPEYCRIQRIQRDVPTKMWEAGVDRTNLRQFIHDNYEFTCRCIRCREPKGREVNWEKVRVEVVEYEASGGVEFFISAVDPISDILLGFCRLRFPNEYLRSEITSTSALIRELHVYGSATALGGTGVVQHKGWGRKLVEKAEVIAREHGKDKMVVISGVGVREYYKERLGYCKEGVYMVKDL